jgi:hypothetical protein
MAIYFNGFLQAPKEQKSKEAKAIAAANSSKGKKKVNKDIALLWKLDCGLNAKNEIEPLKASGLRHVSNMLFIINSICRNGQKES